MNTESAQNTEEILLYILTQLLKLWHPFCPFITEYIWTDLLKAKSMLIVSQWPKPTKYQPVKEFALVQAMVIDVRNQKLLPRPAGESAGVYKINDKKIKVIKKYPEVLAYLRFLTKDETIELVGQQLKFEVESRPAASGLGEGIVAKKIEEKIKIIKEIETRLANQEFLQKAPAAAINKQKDLLKSLKEELNDLENQAL